MLNKIHPNDIPVLAKIINPKTDEIWVLVSKGDAVSYQDIDDYLGCCIRFFTHFFDLQKAWGQKEVTTLTIIHLGQQKLDWALLPNERSATIIDFKLNNTSSKWQFSFINNPDGTIRWIYPSNNQRAVFLNLYNGAGWKGQLIEQGFKRGFQLGLKKWLQSGRFKVIAKQCIVETIKQQLQASHYAIFTGTIGINRKAVISFEERGVPTCFLKLPLTTKGEQLCEKEAQYLTKLQPYSFETLNIPKVNKKGKGIVVSNIRPQKNLNNEALSPIHLKALSELYAQTAETHYLGTTSVWQSIQKDLQIIASTQPINNLPIQKIAAIQQQLFHLADQMDATKSILLTIAHADLTPWNTYLSPTKLHVFDWELAEKLPPLYDAFHFIFQSSILVKRDNFFSIQSKIKMLQNSPIVQSILTIYKVDFHDLYQFYLLRNISYYLSRYLRQPRLHIQAFWLVDVWEKALVDLGEWGGLFAYTKISKNIS